MRFIMLITNKCFVTSLFGHSNTSIPVKWNTGKTSHKMQKVKRPVRPVIASETDILKPEIGGGSED